jgi:serine/threonine protein kinase
MPRCPTCQSEYGEGSVYCPQDGQALLPMILEGRYRLLSPLGAGGMGMVYLAEHIGLGKRVAVKVLRGELSRDATFSRRFELEAIAASQIGHENIVDVTDLGRTPSGELFYVMELLEGRSLGAVLLRERFLPVARAVPILVQVCRALEAAHARGIVHRDVKPQNVMLLAREGRPDFVKVVDFGISKVSNPQGGKLTDVGAILGTADYMAPEQATGGEVDTSADVYAVGVLTYELCTGTLPFRGENTFATMLQHMEAKAEPPSKRRPELGLPPELDALVLQALAKEPNGRPSMARFRAGLEALPAGTRPILLTQQATTASEPALMASSALASPLTPSTASAPVPAMDEAALPSTTISTRPRSRSMRTWALVGAISVVLAVMARLLFVSGQSPAAPVSAPAPAPAPVEASATPQEPVQPTPPPEAAKPPEVPLKKLPPSRVRKPPSSEPKKVQDLKPNPF